MRDLWSVTRTVIASANRTDKTYPRFLIGMDLNETAKLVYIILLNRARISARKGEYADGDGNVYVLYNIADLADDCGKSPSTVKGALRALEKADLILREEQTDGQPRRLFIKTMEELPRAKSCPRGESKFCPPGGSKFCPPPGQYSASPGGRNLSPYYIINKKNINKKNINKKNDINYDIYEEGDTI